VIPRDGCDAAADGRDMACGEEVRIERRRRAPVRLGGVMVGNLMEQQLVGVLAAELHSKRKHGEQRGTDQMVAEGCCERQSTAETWPLERMCRLSRDDKLSGRDWGCGGGDEWVS
jgi:hypothetical protein